MAKMTVRDVDVKGKRALVRVDFNVPLDDARQITDDNRIRAALPTIQYLLEQGGAVVLMSHLGRPRGEKVPEMSLAPAAARLGELLGQPVSLAPDCIGLGILFIVVLTFLHGFNSLGNRTAGSRPARRHAGPHLHEICHNLHELMSHRHP